jgi:hypothetical protein
MKIADLTYHPMKHQFLSSSLLLCLLFIGSIGYGQWTIGAYSGPSLQNILSGTRRLDYLKPHLLTQSGLIARGKLVGRLGLRTSLSYESVGTHQLMLVSRPDFFMEEASIRIDFAKVAAGLSYAVPLSSRLKLEGFADFAYGLPIVNVFKFYVDEEVTQKFRGNARNAYFNRYLGTNLGLSLGYATQSGVVFRFSPTAQFQFNSFWREFNSGQNAGGLASRFEVAFPIARKDASEKLHKSRGRSSIINNI